MIDSLLRRLYYPSPAPNDWFGFSVAISGSLAAVGAPFADSGGVDGAGKAYVVNATTGALVTTLDNPAPATADTFGYSVAIFGNLVAVGAYRDDPGGVFRAGTAYVFDATTGSLTATLDNPAPTASDYFGYSVAVSGSVAVVGAYWDDPGGVNAAGTAYVFDATTGVLMATLDNPDPTSLDFFGHSVAVSGNVAVVGAYGDNPGGVSGAGTAYVFNAMSGALTATLDNPSPATSDWFGISVAISGNVAVIGAQGDDPGGVSSAGTAYIFDATTGVLTATLDNPAPASSDIFGSSVSVFGNMALVGAYRDDLGGRTDAGTAYVFDATTGALTVTLVNPAPTASDFFRLFGGDLR